MVSSVNCHKKNMTFSEGLVEAKAEIPQNQVPNELVKKSEPKKKYTCSFCNELFRNKDSLDRHLYHHTHEKKFVCSFEGCSCSYTNVAHLRRHVKRIHTDQLRQHSIDCIDPDCAATFATKESMRRHFNEVHKKEKYICSTCGEQFNRKQQLKRHSITHTGQYPYKCEVCGKGAINLKAHIRHRASHIHNCVECGRVFKNWNGLVAHRKISHTNEFKCETCNKVFISQKNLNFHMKVHLNQDDRSVFQCTYDKCAKFYYEKRNLMAHIRSKHEGRKFICGYEDCGKQISTKQKLILHLKLHLSEKMGAKSRPSSRRSSIDSVKKVRRDKGKKKVSAVSILTGVIASSDVEKALLENKGDEVLVPEKLLPSGVLSSDMSDMEAMQN